jgi:hypothetical protein
VSSFLLRKVATCDRYINRAGVEETRPARFDELRGRAAAHIAILYAFDLIEHDREDLRNRPFLDRKAALARLLRYTELGIMLNEQVARQGSLTTIKKPSFSISLLSASEVFAQDWCDKPMCSSTTIHEHVRRRGGHWGEQFRLYGARDR